MHTFREEKERKSSCFHVFFVIIFPLLFRIQVKKTKKKEKRKKKKRALTFTGSNHFTICSSVLLPEHTFSAAEQSALRSPSFWRQGCQQFLNCNSMNKAFFLLLFFFSSFFPFQSLEFFWKGRRVWTFHQIVSKTELFPIWQFFIWVRASGKNVKNTNMLVFRGTPSRFAR